MTKPELGVKRDCPECGARFYDLCNEPAHCPKCEHEFVPEILLKPRRSRPVDGENKAKAENSEAPETSLESADKEAEPAKGARKASLDEDDSDDDDEADELADIEDIDDVKVKEDDTLIDDDEDNDMSDIVPTSKDES